MARRWLAPGEFKELVQIGAVRIDIETLTPLADYDVLVKPRINPVLSDYFVDLTGITNEAVSERGVDFLDAYNGFLDFCDGAPLSAFGRDDLILVDSARLYGINDLRPLPPYVNAVWTLLAGGVDPRGYHACDVGRLCGVPFEGHEHDALADARSVALGLQALVARGVQNPFAEFIR
jgi:hypothetical protein